MILIFLSFWDSFSWYPIPPDIGDNNMCRVIIDSKDGSPIIRQYGGEANLVKGFIRLDGDIFKGGVMVLLPENFEVIKTPQDLKLIKRSIQINKYNRYSALYEDGELKEEWRELVSEIEEILRISSLEDLSPNKLSEYFPERFYLEEEEIKKIVDVDFDIEKEDLEVEKIITYPSKHYFSFILVKEGYREKLIPVVLHLSPIDEKIDELQNIEEEGGER